MLPVDLMVDLLMVQARGFETGGLYVHVLDEHENREGLLEGDDESSLRDAIKAYLQSLIPPVEVNRECHK